MNEDEKEEARRWLESLIRLYKQNESAFHEIASLDHKSVLQDWDKVYSNENARNLLRAKQILEEEVLPKSKHKSLKKLRGCFSRLVTTCCTAGTLYLKSYYAGDISRKRHAEMIFFTSFVEGLIKDFERKLHEVRQEIG